MSEKLDIPQNSLLLSETVSTVFNCSIQNRDDLEQLINDNINKYSADEIINFIIQKGISEYVK